MKPWKTFKDLIVWQKAHQFVLMVYKYTAKFPKDETMDSCLSSGGQRSPLRRISPKVLRERLNLTRCEFSISQKARGKNASTSLFWDMAKMPTLQCRLKKLEGCWVRVLERLTHPDKKTSSNFWILAP